VRVSKHRVRRTKIGFSPILADMLPISGKPQIGGAPE
jgi:hypothetical protein